MIRKANDKDYYAYETDGLVFTPQHLGVGMNDENDKPNNIRKHGNVVSNGSLQSITQLISWLRLKNQEQLMQ